VHSQKVDQKNYSITVTTQAWMFCDKNSPRLQPGETESNIGAPRLKPGAILMAECS